MKVLLNAFDSDTARGGPFPNLALMKLAAHHRSRGDQVALIGKGLARQDRMDDPDRVYVSCVYSENGTQALGTRWMYPDAEFIAGGSGIDLHHDLSGAIETCQPDYEIYDGRGIPGWPYALGFSSRGCGRKCPFCIVSEKEGKIRQASPLEEIVGDHGRLLLLDNNLMMDPLVEEKLKWLAEWGGGVNLNQGVDARVVARRPNLAYLLAGVRYRTRKFNGKMLTLAYDHPRYSKSIETCIGHLEEAGHSLRHNIQFYVLTNYDTTFDQDLQRCLHLRELGTAPYVMIYDKKKAPLQVRRLQRWANARQVFWTTDWEDYDASIKGHIKDFEAEMEVGS